MTIAALLLTWLALDIAILVALTRWKHPDPPPADEVIAYIGAKRLVRKGKPRVSR